MALLKALQLKSIRLDVRYPNGKGRQLTVRVAKRFESLDTNTVLVKNLNVSTDLGEGLVTLLYDHSSGKHSGSFKPLIDQPGVVWNWVGINAIAIERRP